MAKYIEREAAIEAALSCTDSFEPIEVDITVENIVSKLRKLPIADVQPVTHCKDCVYRPYYEPSDSKSVSDLVFPDYRFNPCPCRVEDIWYSWMPDDDWFCAYGKREDGKT